MSCLKKVSSLLQYLFKDYGTLSCWATNSVGHQEQPCMFQIVAAGKPFPVRNCSLSNQTSSSVEVACVPGFDGGLPQHFVLELYTSTSAVPRYNITALEPHFLLIDLEPDVTFRIVVFAVNAKGRSAGISTEEVLFTDAEKRTGLLSIIFVPQKKTSDACNQKIKQSHLKIYII